MKRNILLQFDDDDTYADVLVAIRNQRGTDAKSTVDPGERAEAIAAICRSWQPARNEKPTNGAPLPGQRTLPIMSDD